MRITCPACGARYEVEDGLIPPAGRAVQCSNCNAAWRARPEARREPAAAALSPAGPAPLMAAPLVGVAATSAQPAQASIRETQAAMIASMEEADDHDRPGFGRFSVGLSLVALIAAGAVAVYVKHAAIVALAPSLAEPLAAYVSAVDDGRARLSEALR